MYCISRPGMSTRKKGENNQLLSMILSMGLKSLHSGVGHAWVMSEFLGVLGLSSNWATLV